MALIEFTGNCPKNVSRDAKYSLRRHTATESDWEIRLEYRIDYNDRVLLSTIEHRDLIEMVLAVQLENRSQGGGTFYINEYRQVIVPGGPNGEYYYSGEYTNELAFKPANDPELEGWIISGDGKDRNGERLVPGDEWVGPHPGIPYVLAASLQDVYYERTLSPVRTRRITLSSETSASRAREVAQQIASTKGQSGRFYINEYSQTFCPVQSDGRIVYLYSGAIDIEAGWFKPWANLSK